MRFLADAHSELAILQRLIAKLPSGHNVRVLDHTRIGQRESGIFAQE